MLSTITDQVTLTLHPRAAGPTLADLVHRNRAKTTVAHYLRDLKHLHNQISDHSPPPFDNPRWLGYKDAILHAMSKIEVQDRKTRLISAIRGSLKPQDDFDSELYDMWAEESKIHITDAQKNKQQKQKDFELSMRTLQTI